MCLVPWAVSPFLENASQLPQRYNCSRGRSSEIPLEDDWVNGGVRLYGEAAPVPNTPLTTQRSKTFFDQNNYTPDIFLYKKIPAIIIMNTCIFASNVPNPGPT